jgi:hypothetical protein
LFLAEDLVVSPSDLLEDRREIDAIEFDEIAAHVSAN